MFERKNTSFQELRQMALKTQLLAVDAQAASLQSMDREHSFGLESSQEIERLRQQVHSFVTDALAVARQAESSCLLEVKAAATSLAHQAKDLKSNADRLQKNGELRAKFRHDKEIGNPDDVPETATETPVPTDARKLKARADFACLRAEVDEYGAYALQIHALCNLALEYCFNAAIKCARCESSI